MASTKVARVVVHVRADTRRERVTKDAKGEFYIEVREEAARNAANQRAREIIADAHGTEVKKVKIVTGHRSPKKIMSIG
ncbi:MAG: hypothetical protein RLZZ234_346 [Candidatus Parcubacteria bacterium]|jgi:uncharacterized protein YggU (UPF0235/DUF167 family)